MFKPNKASDFFFRGGGGVVKILPSHTVINYEHTCQLLNKPSFINYFSVF